MRPQRYLLAALFAAILIPGTDVWAQAKAKGKDDDYPNRPVRMIVPFAPGGASDTVGRIIQPAMADLLKQQVVVDNRGGAAGNIGVELAVKASPDGYNFLLGNIGTMAINPNYYTRFPHRPLQDLIPITQVVDVPGSVVVHPSIPAKSIKELIAHMKANPGKLNYGAPAPSSANTLETIQFLRATGTDAVQVNYKGGAGPAMIGLLANEIQLMFVTFSSAVTFAKQGRVRMLGVISPERNPAYPEIPTMREQGLDMVVGSWQGIFVPKGTPQPVVNKLFKVGSEMMKDQRVVKRLGDSGITIVSSKSQTDFVAFLKKETERFGKVIRDAKIQTE
ncbi:MAG: tripartite tricarboxylate transporter substrate binding protein [Betaproteobacteria bacterium]|nr:tripartite tricarboxylate transporter substrate binding protein [Betaproteobacteria bacterium]